MRLVGGGAADANAAVAPLPKARTFCGRAITTNTEGLRWRSGRFPVSLRCRLGSFSQLGNPTEVVGEELACRTQMVRYHARNACGRHGVAESQIGRPGGLRCGTRVAGNSRRPGHRANYRLHRAGVQPNTTLRAWKASANPVSDRHSTPRIRISDQNVWGSYHGFVC